MNNAPFSRGTIPEEDYMEGESNEALMRKIIQRCAKSRIWFIKNILGVEEIEEWQEEILTALDNGETRISIRSGHGVGKTALCAWLAVHFLLFRDDVKIPVTAPASSQMKDGLIPEINKWISRLPTWLSQNLDITSERITRGATPEEHKNNFISFRTARPEKPEALAGIHASHVMVLVDEASGVPEPIYNAAAGTMSTAGAIIILIGNPTRAEGLFYKTHTILADKWLTKRVSCFESSRVDQAFIDDIVATHGVESNEYRIRVMGEFPESTADKVIPKQLIDDAIGRDVAPIDGELYWGVDPARGGDKSGFCARRENTIEELIEWSDPDVMRITGRVKAKWDELPPLKRPKVIFVDSIGLGAGVADRLRELELPVVDVNVAEVPAMKDRYPRLRAELWYSVRAWLDSRAVNIPIDLPLTRKLAGELAGPEALYTSTGKADVESKAHMKLRGVASPNLADALCLTFAGDGGAVAAGRFNHRAGWGKPLDYQAHGVV